jgi:uncharacterized tellurite resistance protein B-like protein
MNIDALAKASAFVLWADGKIEEDELKAVDSLFEKYGVDDTKGKKLLKEWLDDFIDAGEETEEEIEETEEDISIGVIDFGEVDEVEILTDLAVLACSDKKLAMSEIEIIIQIAEAMNVSHVLSTAAIVSAVKKSGTEIDF